MCVLLFLPAGARGCHTDNPFLSPYVESSVLGEAIVSHGAYMVCQG